MATNNYFQGGKGPGAKSEQDILESNIIEMIQMAGQDFFYVPRTMLNPDDLFHENPVSSFKKFYSIEMYPVNVVNYGGQGDMYTKFGLSFDNTLELVISRYRFYEETQRQQPDEGDLIYWPLTRVLFQIDYVQDEPTDQFYQLSKLYTLTLKCSSYTHSYEEFDTGIKHVDTDLDVTTFEDTLYKADELINTEARESEDLSDENLFGDRTEP